MNEFEAVVSYNWSYWALGLIIILAFISWVLKSGDIVYKVFKKAGIKTKRMLEREKAEQRLANMEKAIEEIKDTSKHNVEMFLDHERQVVEKFTDIKNEIVSELGKIHMKIDEQQKQLEVSDREGKKRDCAVLRDRILGGMRYFSQNTDSRGKAHISISDHENMEHLFEEYFECGGNGTIKQLYEKEFKHFIIDR